MNRREFFKTLAFSALSISAASTTDFEPLARLWAEEAVPLDPNLVAIFSDIHLLEPETTRQSARFAKAVAQVLALNPRPATLLIYGDVANSEGNVDDYKIFRRLIAPLEKAGVRWEVAMGNHDRLDVFRSVFPERFEKTPPIENKYINVVETPRADFILLDSYLKGEVRGEIDPAQREWLAETLKKYLDKPVFVGCHHPLKETALEDLLRACPKFAGYLYGHNHWWKITNGPGEIPAICFPSVGHWGDMGFAMLNLTETEAIFAPTIDAYFLPDWNQKKKVEEADVPAYLAELNRKTATFALP